MNWKSAIEQTLRQGQWDNALAQCRSALEQNPLWAQGWVYMGDALQLQGASRSAWAAYERAWILDPLAAWVASKSAELDGYKSGPVPHWLEDLLRPPQQRVVGAILCRNEASNIVRCIEALSPAVDDLVLIDTGSDDNTVALARSTSTHVRILEVPWEDDFGRARRHADPVLGDQGWVLWVDADEFVLPEDQGVPRIIAGLASAVSVPILYRIGQVNHLGNSLNTNYDMTRFYPLGQGIHWEGRIHEQVVCQDDRTPFHRAAARIRVEHWGYEPEVMRSRHKYARNIRLLQRSIDDDPTNPVFWGFLGRDLGASGETAAAIDALRKAEQYAARHPNYARLPEVRSTLCESLVRQGDWSGAHDVALRATAEHPEHPSGWYWLAHTALLSADASLKEAMAAAAKVPPTARTYRGLVAFDPDISEFHGPLTLADSLKMSGRWSEALTIYRTLSAHPRHHELMTTTIQSMIERARSLLATAADGTTAGETGQRDST